MITLNLFALCLVFALLVASVMALAVWLECVLTRKGSWPEQTHHRRLNRARELRLSAESHNKKEEANAD